MVSIDILTPAFEASRDLSSEEVLSLCHQSLGVPEEDIVIHYITDDHIACKIKNSTYSLDFLESLSQQNSMLVEQVQRAGEALQAFHSRMIDDHATINDLKAQITALREALTTITMSSSSSNNNNSNNNNISTSSHHHHPHLHHHHQQHHHSSHQQASNINTSFSSSSSSSSSFPPPSPSPSPSSSSSSSNVVRGDAQYWRSKYEEEYSVRKRYQDRFERIVASINTTTLATGEERLSPRANIQHQQQQIRYDLKPSRSHEVLSPQAFPSSSSMSNMLSATYPIPSSTPSLSTPSSPQRPPSSAPLLSVPPVTLTLPQDDFPTTTKPSRININIPKLGLQNLTNNPPQSSPLSPHSPHSPNMPASPHSPRSPNSHGGLRRRNTVQNFAPFVTGPHAANLVGGVAIGLGLSAGTLAPPGGGVGGVGGFYGLEDVFCRLCTCEIFRPLPHVEWVCACGHANIKHGGSRSPSQSPRALDI